MGNLDRSEAISLLKELRATFHTFETTPYVLLKNSEREGLWELHISWIPDQQEQQELVSLARGHRLNVFFQDDQTIFRRSR